MPGTYIIVYQKDPVGVKTSLDNYIDLYLYKQYLSFYC